MVAAALVPALNHLLRESGWALSRLAPHAGRTACVAFPPIGEMRFVVNGDGSLAVGNAAAAPDLHLSLPGEALIRLRGDRQSLIGQARIQGHVEFAEALGFVLRHLQWDAEEDLSRIFGDVAARRLAGAGRFSSALLADSARRLSANIVESAALPDRTEFTRWSESVDAAQAHGDQLAARLAALESRRAERRALAGPAPTD